MPSCQQRFQVQIHREVSGGMARSVEVAPDYDNGRGAAARTEARHAGKSDCSAEADKLEVSLPLQCGPHNVQLVNIAPMTMVCTQKTLNNYRFHGVQKITCNWGISTLDN